MDHHDREYELARAALEAPEPGPAAAGEGRRGGRFRKGRSGNPQGRPKGSRNAVTLMLEALLDGAAAEIGDKMVALAKEGDSRALKACFDRILPPRRDRPVAFRLPGIARFEDLPSACGAIMDAAAKGEITPSETLELMRAIGAGANALRAAGADAQAADQPINVLSDKLLSVEEWERTCGATEAG